MNVKGKNEFSNKFIFTRPLHSPPAPCDVNCAKQSTLEIGKRTKMSVNFQLSDNSVYRFPDFTSQYGSSLEQGPWRQAV